MTCDSETDDKKISLFFNHYICLSITTTSITYILIILFVLVKMRIMIFHAYESIGYFSYVLHT